MATAQSVGAVVSGPGKVTYASKKSKMCKAFRLAVKRYCDPNGNNGQGKFNNWFFDALKEKSPSMWKNLLREVPIGAVVGGVVQSFAQMAAGGGALGKGAQTLLDRLAAKSFDAANSSADAMRGGIGGGIRNNIGEPGLFPDAMTPDGAAIEVKGPGDGPNPVGQPENYAAASKRKRCTVVNCKSCGAKCNSTGCT